MNFDDPTVYATLDPQNMLGEIDGLPDQLAKAWELGQTQPLPTPVTISRVVIAGMGGSAIGADLLTAYIEPTCSVPVIVQRDYTLPAWATGPETFVIASSHSGNTEETLSVFEQAHARNCTILAVATGGKLAKRAAETNTPMFTFAHKGQPRAAVGYSFGLLLAAFTRLGLIPDPRAELEDAVAAMRAAQSQWQINVPTVENPAKRQAGQLMGRWIAVFGSELLAPVARRWKGQVSELAKAWGQFEFLPEADHNSLAGLMQPENHLGNMIAMFLLAPSYHPRNVLRGELTKKAFMLEGVSTDFFVAQGETRLAQQWTTLLFGDYMAYYLAIAYGADPTPIPALEAFKAEMAGAN